MSGALVRGLRADVPSAGATNNVSPEEFARLHQAQWGSASSRGRVRTASRFGPDAGYSLSQRRAWYAEEGGLRLSSDPNAFSQYSDRQGRGFGQLVGMETDVTERGLQKVINHLTNSPYLDAGAVNTVENQLMISRLRNALDNGTPIRGADLSFYLHEMTEYDIGLQLVERNPTVGQILSEIPAVDRYDDIPQSVHGIALNQLQSSNRDLWRQVVYQYSHQSALNKFGVSQFSVYSLEAAQAGGLSQPFLNFWR